MTAAKKNRNSAIRLVKKILAAPFVFIAAVLILLEDWLWDDLARLAAAIGEHLRPEIVRFPAEISPA